MPACKTGPSLVVLLAVFWTQRAGAEDWPPLTLPVGNAELRLDGDAAGALFTPKKTSGLVRLMPSLRRDYDSGLSLGLNGVFTAADPLSRGRYDGDWVEKLDAEARTGLGKVAVGLTDGAGYTIAVTGPKVDAGVSLEDPRTTFFRSPTGRVVTQVFALRTAVGASSNYAKFTYTSPLLFGAQLALSFTPSQGKQLPFLNAGPHVAGRQADMAEAALRYEGDVGPVTLTVYGAVAEGRAEHKLPGQEGVSDLGVGLRAEYPVNDDVSVSLGGSWRQSNAYTFDIDRSYQSATTRAQHVSAMVSDGAWRAGVEYGNGAANAAANVMGAAPRIGLNGLEASLGYTFTSNVALSGGWQKLSYARSSGVFFNGAPQLKMNALFLHLTIKTSSD